MNRDNNGIEDLFEGLRGQWDTEEPRLGHQQRFLKKLKDKKQKKQTGFLYRIIVPAAAAILIVLGALLIYEPATPQPQFAKVSPQVKETEKYFASIIENELIKLQKENSPETKILVKDALTKLKSLEEDYDKLLHELATKGENKKIIHAMITNLQTRISFLEEVLVQIENVKKLKENYNENKS